MLEAELALKNMELLVANEKVEQLAETLKIRNSEYSFMESDIATLKEIVDDTRVEREFERGQKEDAVKRNDSINNLNKALLSIKFENETLIENLQSKLNAIPRWIKWIFC